MKPHLFDPPFDSPADRFGPTINLGERGPAKGRTENCPHCFAVSRFEVREFPALKMRQHIWRCPDCWQKYKIAKQA